MPPPLHELSQKVHKKLCKLGFRSVPKSIVAQLIEKAYYASLRTEEGSFIRGSLTYADPESPDIDPPLLRRLDYPLFTRFSRQEPLTVETVVKLSRAIDNWSGGITVYRAFPKGLVVWGIVDQRVHENVGIHREAEGGFRNPGLFTVTTEGVGHILVTHGRLFLCELKENSIIDRQTDVLVAKVLGPWIIPPYLQVAEYIARTMPGIGKSSDVAVALFHEWANAVARICIGLRRSGTGGSLLLTPSPLLSVLEIVHPLPYERLYEAIVLKVLDEAYLDQMHEQVHQATISRKDIPTSWILDDHLAEADADDRKDELTGAIKIVSSIASADGAVLLSPTLAVRGFGVKIHSNRSICTVYDGMGFLRRGTRAKKIDITNFGMRHTSMLRYCREDKYSVGIVVSQDGQVRVICTKRGSLLLWHNVKLLDFLDNLGNYARQEHRGRSFHKKYQGKAIVGYTPMPKSIQALVDTAESGRKIDGTKDQEATGILRLTRSSFFRRLVKLALSPKSSRLKVSSHQDK
jgi:hypothetical protein